MHTLYLDCEQLSQHVNNLNWISNSSIIITNRAHKHKKAPNRTVPEGSGPALSLQVKADLRYGPGCLFPHKRHTQDLHPECSLFGAPCARLALGEPIVIEPTNIKRAPHRTVPEGRGPRLSRQVKADLRYDPGCLSPHKRQAQDWHPQCSLLGAPCSGMKHVRNPGCRS
jgi:hypothetical protein